MHQLEFHFYTLFLFSLAIYYIQFIIAWQMNKAKIYHL